MSHWHPGYLDQKVTEHGFCPIKLDCILPVLKPCASHIFVALINDKVNVIVELLANDNCHQEPAITRSHTYYQQRSACMDGFFENFVIGARSFDTLSGQ